MPEPARCRRRWVRRLLVFVAVVGVLMGLLAVFQRKLIYFPDQTDVPPASQVIPGARDVTLRTSDGLELGAWFVPAPADSSRDLAVLVAPGNGGNRTGRAELAQALNRRGLAVMLMDYRGYGGNPGDPTEDGLARDARAAVATLEALGYPPDKSIHFGESLGTGVVAALQAEKPPAGVVLRSPFTALADVGAHHYPWLPVRTLLRDDFAVSRHLARSQVPLTVVYGDSDSVVPTELSAKVADDAPALRDRVVLRGVDHNDAVMFGEPVADAVARLADQVG